MENEVAQSTFEIIKFTKCLLYTHETLTDVLNMAWLRFNPSLSTYRSNLQYWGENYSTEDIHKLEENGITRNDLEVLLETSNQLYASTFLPLGENGSSFRKLSLIFYKNKTEPIRKLFKKLNEIYEGLEEDMKYTSYLVTRDLGGRHIEEDYFQIPNPYQIIPDVVQKAESFIQDIETNGANISMKSFIFSEKFKFLSTYSDDIQNKGLNENEIQELNITCSLLIVKGFLLNQVTIKLNQNDIMQFRDNTKDHSYFSEVGEGDDAVQLYSELKNLLMYFGQINQNSANLNEEKLHDIYQAHLNDESTSILKSFVEEFIPYYKSLITTNGLAILTYQISDKYQKLLARKYVFNYIKKTLPNEYIVCPIYIKLIEFKLINPPGDSYNTLIDIFKVSYHNYFIGEFERDEYPKFPTEMEEVEEFDTLQKQKYYIASYLISFLNKRGDTNVEFQDACLILSLLDWKIDSDAKESKDLEEYIKQTVELNLKEYSYKYDGSFFSGGVGLKHFAKYIIHTVNTTTEPLD